MSLYFNIWNGKITEKFKEYKNYPMEKESTAYFNLDGEFIGFEYNFRIFRQPFTKPLESYWELSNEKLKVNFLKFP